VHSVIPVALRDLIVDCDGSDATRDALRFAALLATVERGRLTLVNVHRPGHRDEALRLVEEAERSLPYGTRATTTVVESRSAAHALQKLADAEAADLIVLPRGQSTVVTSSHCPVAIAPAGFADDPKPGLRVIGVAFDGSPEARKALDTATLVALGSGASIRLIGVAHPPARPVVGIASMYVPDANYDYRDGLLRQLEVAADELPLSLRTQVVLANGDPAPQLIERADSLSLLVIGSRGYGRLRRALLRSVSAQVLRALPCPVLVVPPPEHALPAHEAAAEAVA
jgi:nucleotide-binding universal stress UspA family protein